MPRRKKQKTTRQLVDALLESHFLAPVFIVEAAHTRAIETLRDEDELVLKHKNAIINPQSWVECAKAIDATLKKENHQ